MLYMPYIWADAIGFSGIVTIFFGGLATRRYVSLNLSDETNKHAEAVFDTLAYLAETCIFLELRLSALIWLARQSVLHWIFTASALLAVAVLGRAVAVYSLTILLNQSQHRLYLESTRTVVLRMIVQQSCRRMAVKEEGAVRLLWCTAMGG